MRLSLDIKDDKAAFFLELLKNLSFVKVSPDSVPKEKISVGRPKKEKSKVSQKEVLVAEIEQAIEELELILEGKKEAHNAQDFLNEL